MFSVSLDEQFGPSMHEAVTTIAEYKVWVPKSQAEKNLIIRTSVPYISM